MLDRSLLPDSLRFYEGEGLVLGGRGVWKVGKCVLHDDKSPSFAVHPDTGAFICYSGCGSGGDVIDFVMKRYGLGFTEAVQYLKADSPTPNGGSIKQSTATAGNSDRKACKPITPSQDTQHNTSTLSDYWRGIWKATRPIQSSPVEGYLQLRGCPLPPDGSHVRYCPDLKHPDGWSGPAMIALITDAIDRHPMTLHRTWIEPGNAKAKSRMLIAGHSKKGGVIRLWPDEYVSHGLAIAEGIETALSLSVGYKPVWSLVDAGNLAEFPVLAGIECLVIGADNDTLNPQTGKQAGFSAADECAARWKQAGRDAVIISTGTQKTDFNDLARTK